MIKYIIANIRDFLLQVFWVFYIPAFIYVDNRSASSYHEIHCFLDDVIPFVPVFVLPYFGWFAFFFLTFIYTYRYDLSEYRKQCAAVFGGFIAFLVISLMYPNIQLLRPSVDELSNAGLFSRLCATVYESDTPTNVMPSMHVYQAIVCTIAASRMAAKRKSPKIRAFMWIACAVISVSTVFIKQHSVLDLFGAAALAAVFYIIVYVILERLKLVEPDSNARIRRHS